MRLGVLGGSSPFTAGLIDALAIMPTVPVQELCLHGRNVDALQAVAGYAKAMLPDVVVDWTISAEVACRDSSVVLHQIRYGGLALRGRLEAAALAAGDIADETIGPAARATAAAMREPLNRMSELIVREAPHAHVIMMTNPLGLAMAIMHHAGLANPIGICELPRVTAEKAAALLDVPPGRLAWSYSGLNHRGFLHDLAIDGQDVLPELAVSAAGNPSFGALGVEEIMALGGLPTKYFSIFASGASFTQPGRAETLEAIREGILRELVGSCHVRPATLDAREQPWWPDVARLIGLLASDDEQRMVLDVMRPGGIAEEGWCTVSRNGVRWASDHAVPSADMQRWIDRFRYEERNSLKALWAPDDLVAAVC